VGVEFAGCGESGRGEGGGVPVDRGRESRGRIGASAGRVVRAGVCAGGEPEEWWRRSEISAERGLCGDRGSGRTGRGVDAVHDGAVSGAGGVDRTAREGCGAGSKDPWAGWKWRRRALVYPCGCEEGGGAGGGWAEDRGAIWSDPRSGAVGDRVAGPESDADGGGGFPGEFVGEGGREREHGSSVWEARAGFHVVFLFDHSVCEKCGAGQLCGGEYVQGQLCAAAAAGAWVCGEDHELGILGERGSGGRGKLQPSDEATGSRVDRAGRRDGCAGEIDGVRAGADGGGQDDRRGREAVAFF